jgi:integrase
MPVYKKSKGKWRIRIYINGKPKDEIFEGTKEEAKSIEAVRLLALRATDPDLVHRETPTFEVFALGEYKEFCAGRIKATWWNKQKYVLATLIEHFGSYRLDRIPQKSVHAFTTSRQESLGTKSLNNELRVFRRVLNVARKEFKYPVADLTITGFKETGRGKAIAWSDDQMKSLLDAAATLDVELMPILIFIANTGCRNGEALALEWKQVDLERGYICFWPSEDWQPKDNEPREVPIGEALRPWLEGPRQHEQWVFPSRLGSRFAYWPKLRWEAVRDAAKLEGGVHQLRHTYASHFLKNKPDLVLLASVLGHSDVAVTKTYQHMLPDHLARARDAVSFTAPVGPAAVEAHRRSRMTKRKPTKKSRARIGQTVPRTVPSDVTNLVTIERDTRFELATFSLGS